MDQTALKDAIFICQLVYLSINLLALLFCFFLFLFGILDALVSLVILAVPLSREHL